MSTKRRAFIRVSPEVLARALHLRADIKIVRARLDFKTETFEFVLSGPTLPESGPGMEVLRIDHSEVSEFQR